MLATSRFFAEPALSSKKQILRFAQDDSEGLRMTPLKLYGYFRGTTLACFGGGVFDPFAVSSAASAEANCTLENP